MSDIAEFEFQNACQVLHNKAIMLDATYRNKLSIGQPVPGQMVGLLENLDNGGSILVYLANNLKDYKRICSLDLIDMKNELFKLSTFLKHL